MNSFEELESIELQTPTEIAQITEIRVPVVKAMAYIDFAVKESNYADSLDMTAAMTTDATHELLDLDSPEEYLIQSVLSLENAISVAESEGYPRYKSKLVEIKELIEDQHI